MERVKVVWSGEGKNGVLLKWFALERVIVMCHD